MAEDSKCRLWSNRIFSFKCHFKNSNEFYILTHNVCLTFYVKVSEIIFIWVKKKMTPGIWTLLILWPWLALSCPWSNTSHLRVCPLVRTSTSIMIRLPLWWDYCTVKDGLKVGATRGRRVVVQVRNHENPNFKQWGFCNLRALARQWLH